MIYQSNLGRVNNESQFINRSQDRSGLARFVRSKEAFPVQDGAGQPP